MFSKLAFTLQRSLNPFPNNLFGYDYAILWPPFVQVFIRFPFQTFRAIFVLSGSSCLLDKRKKNHTCKQLLKKKLLVLYIMGCIQSSGRANISGQMENAHQRRKTKNASYGGSKCTAPLIRLRARIFY